MGRTDRRNTRCRVTWLSSQSRLSDGPSKTLPATSSHRSRGLWSTDLGGSCDARRCRPNPGVIADQVLSRMTRTQLPFSTPGTSINAIGLLEIENKIQLVDREMKCKNNRWEESRRRNESLSVVTIGGWRGILPGRFLPRD